MEAASGPPAGATRLRQAVLVARELAPAVAQLRAGLALGEPFADPAVAAFGLRNAVMALGGDFLEVVAPLAADAPAARELARRGEGGYMLIAQVEDMEAARSRAAALGIRTVWSIDLPDISATHLHPADVGGAILSVDRPVPAESWRWGGPAWIGGAAASPPGRLRGATVSVPDPSGTAERWARLLDLEPASTLQLGGGDQEIAFVEGGDGLTEVVIEAPQAAGHVLELARTRVLASA